MSPPELAVSDDQWMQLLQRVKELPEERQSEIIDYIGFILDREASEEWELSEEDKAELARHRQGDLTGTLRIEDVEDAILRGAVDEL